MASSHPISLFVAFSAGLLSFVSPCVLPLVPSYLSYITGLSLEELTREGNREKVRWTILQNSVMFILGFSVVFIALGASATAIGRILLSYQDLIRKVGGVLLILLGLWMLGYLKIQFLGQYGKLPLSTKPPGVLGSFVVGIVFAAGWTPCIGPILGAILLYASMETDVLKGVQLLFVYSLGIGLPLFLASLGLSAFLASVKRVKGYLWAVTGASGVFLIFVGITLFTNSFTMITAFLDRHGIGWYIGQ